MHHLYRNGPVNGVGGLTQIFLHVSKTLTDMANTLVETDLLVPSYDTISEILSTRPGTPHTRRATPIQIAIWMTKSQRCKGSNIDNTEPLMAQSVH